MTIRVVETENSTYEIDTVNRKIRRVLGINEPTRNQGDDNVWKHYYSLHSVLGGYLIEWEPPHGPDENGILPRLTLTSPVVNEYDKALSS